jgi:hypothetical protein
VLLVVVVKWEVLDAQLVELDPYSTKLEVL